MTLGIGIIGCGNISTTYLDRGDWFKGMEVRAVADMNMDAAKARAEQYDVRAESVDDLLAADDIDVIVNLTIPAAHYDLNRRALEAGKHVYTEKPLVLSLEEAESLRSIAEEKGLRVGSAPDTFLGGSHQLARAVLDEGLIGRVTAGTAHVLSPGMEQWHPNPDFFFQPGAGPILDIGPYYVTNLVQLLGPVKTVTAMASSAKAERTIGSGPREGETVPVDTPTNIHAVLEFASGALVTVGASWDVQATEHQPMELYGEEGTLYVPDPNFFGGDVTLAKADHREKVERRDHPFHKANQVHGDLGRANYRGAGLADMIQAIEEGRPHRCGLDLAVHVTDVMTGILRAAETRGFVDMTTTCDRPAPLTPEEAEALLVETD